MKYSSPLGKYRTVFQIELVGLIHGTSKVLKKNVRNKCILYLTDIKDILLARMNYKFTSKLLVEVQEILSSISKANTVTLARSKVTKKTFGIQLLESWRGNGHIDLTVQRYSFA